MTKVDPGGASAVGEMKYAVVLEQAENNFSAYVPDLPGCVAAGATRSEVEQLIREAIVLHLESMREHNEPIPEPKTWTELVEATP
jgi:predicted RNase H-like HicB family nuclease